MTISTDSTTKTNTVSTIDDKGKEEGEEEKDFIDNENQLIKIKRIKIQ